MDVFKTTVTTTATTSPPTRASIVHPATNMSIDMNFPRRRSMRMSLVLRQSFIHSWTSTDGSITSQELANGLLSSDNNEDKSQELVETGAAHTTASPPPLNLQTSTSYKIENRSSFVLNIPDVFHSRKDKRRSSIVESTTAVLDKVYGPEAQDIPKGREIELLKEVISPCISKIPINQQTRSKFKSFHKFPNTSISKYSTKTKIKMANCVSDAYLCCYTAFNCGDCTLCCKGKSECLCIVQEECLAAGEDSLGCGVVTNSNNNECCKVAVPCCALGIKTPDKLCAIASQSLCCVQVASFPFDDEYLGEATCSICFISCCPKGGCCVEPPECSALNKPIKEYMDR
jgi:hypothetical protein